MAVVRTCDALGIQDVHFIAENEKAFDPMKIGKSTSSTARKWVDYHAWASTKECLQQLQGDGYVLVATMVSDDAESIFDVTFDQEKIALLIGNERNGLSKTAAQMADRHVVIPMRGMVQSLNVSVAAAIFLYEITRQRIPSIDTFTPNAAQKRTLINRFQKGRDDVSLWIRFKSSDFFPMDSRAFSDGAILKAAWQRTKDRLGFFIILGIILAIFFIAASFLIAWISSESEAGGWIATIVYWIISSIIGIGLIKIVLDVADGNNGALVDLVTHWNLLLKYIAVTIVYGVVVWVGLILLIFPGIIWSLKFLFAPWLVVDKGMGPLEAMKASSRMTMGMKWDLFGFLAAGYVVFAIGVVCLGVGVFVTGPLFAIASAMVYRHMAKGMSAPSAAPAACRCG